MEEDATTLRAQRAEAEENLEKVLKLWEKAYGEFKELRLLHKQEKEAHKVTQDRLADVQRMLDALTKVASAALEEHHELKEAYEFERSRRLQLEGLLGAEASQNLPPSIQAPSSQASSTRESDAYLIPTLSDLSERLNATETQLAQQTARANSAEATLERFSRAAASALEEFNELKQTYAKESVNRQEAEKLVAEYQIKLQAAGLSTEIDQYSTPQTPGGSQDDDRLKTERQLRQLAEAEVERLSKELNERQGNHFDLMTLTELEVKLEDAQRALFASEERNTDLQDKLDKATLEVNDLKSRVGESAPPPPPPPPPPVFIAVKTSDNLKQRLGALKNKLSGNNAADPLTDLRAAAITELNERLKNRKLKPVERAEKPQEHKETGQMANLAVVLKKANKERAEIPTFSVSRSPSQPSPSQPPPSPNQLVSPTTQLRKVSAPASLGSNKEPSTPSDDKPASKSNATTTDTAASSGSSSSSSTLNKPANDKASKTVSVDISDIFGDLDKQFADFKGTLRSRN